MAQGANRSRVNRRRGHDLRYVDVPPRPVHRVSADYPARARSKGLEGYVTMSILIDDDGLFKTFLWWKPHRQMSLIPWPLPL